MEEKKQQSRTDGRGRRNSGKSSEWTYGKQRTNIWPFGLQLGFFAGLIWGLIHWIAYEFNLTETLPGFLLEPFFLSSYLKSGWGLVLGIASFIVFSIVATYLYYFLFGRIRGPWAGMIYGIVWWAVWFVFAGPWLKMVKPVTLIGWDTLITEFCIYLLWGLFIGYTVAYEYTDESSREPLHARHV